MSALARRHPDRAAEHSVLASLPSPREHESEVAGVLHTLGQLWLAGVEVDWPAFSARERRHRLPLPSYPFERQRYWMAPPQQDPQRQSRQARSAKNPEVADWFYIPSWQRSVLPRLGAAGGRGEHQQSWVVFADACGVGAQVVSRLRQQGQEVTAVLVGEQFAQLDEAVYSIHPRRRDDYEALFRELHGQQKTPTTVVHCWSITPGNQGHPDAEVLGRAQDTGFYSVLLLAQALGEQYRTEPLHVVVVSSNLHEVTGLEELCPEKATLLGCCKVLPQEYPNITCRSLDVVPAAAGTRQTEQLAEQITAEIRAHADDPVVAYRGPHRWVQTFVPIRLDSETTRPALLRHRGVYLITGGLGGVGLLLAEYLARTVQAKLVLTSRTGLPPRAEWEQLQAVEIKSHINLELEEEVSYINRTAEKIEAELKIKGVQYYPGLEESLNKLCDDIGYLRSGDAGEMGTELKLAHRDYAPGEYQCQSVSRCDNRRELVPTGPQQRL